MAKTVLIASILRVVLLTAIISVVIAANAQSVAINNNGVAANNSAILDVSSTTKGMLIPRMASAQRTSIVSPAEGLIVYDTDAKGFWYYSNNTWNEIPKSAGGGGVFNLPYTGSASTPSKVFSITNTNSTLGSAALHGQNGNAPSGIVVPLTSGVWGDNTDGPGIIGTSLNQNGVLGIGVNDHGVKGISTFTGKAGVYGKNDASNSYGVMGEVLSTGAAVYGVANQPAGKGGLFEINNTGNADMALDVRHWGLGMGASVLASNTNSTSNALTVTGNTNGDGLYALHLDQGATTSAMRAYHAGTGQGIYTKSFNGVSAKVIIDNENNMNEALLASTTGKGNAGVFIKNNITGSISDIHKPAVLIDNNSKGNALKISSLHAPSVNAAVQVDYDGQAFGINVNSTHGGIATTSSSATFPSLTANNFSGGNAIRASASSNSNAAIYAENTSAVVGNAIYAQTTGTSTSTILAIGHGDGTADGAIKGQNMGGGPGILGENANPSWGIGVMGTVGYNNAGGLAGYFIKTGTSTAGAVLQTLNQGLGVNTILTSTDDANNSPVLQIEHNGSGKLTSFKSNYTEVASVNNNGSFITSSTVTVKNNKGIVRSSTSTQLRYETKATSTIVSAGLAVGATISVNISFATVFSSAPVVSVGNINTGFIGICDELSTSITNVTTTGCTLKIINNGPSASGPFSGVWNIIAIGAE